jgi:hypothetical protein
MLTATPRADKITAAGGQVWCHMDPRATPCSGTRDRERWASGSRLRQPERSKQASSWSGDPGRCPITRWTCRESVTWLGTIWMSSCARGKDVANPGGAAHHIRNDPQARAAPSASSMAARAACCSRPMTQQADPRPQPPWTRPSGNPYAAGELPAGAVDERSFGSSARCRTMSRAARHGRCHRLDEFAGDSAVTLSSIL